MTVKELIEELAKMPQDLVVLTRGYESGWNLVEGLGILEVLKQSSEAYWEGEYQEYDKDDDEGEEGEIIRAVCIGNSAG